ncbi:hypothetical protein M9H77_29710 [Catharanthus roseus]|uniref:Uncharacterized protein n=1 Tax=Catharanthus roseus TaxID=4058 RepID=A0ACB9ZZG0_CATRO|nr:hypothetical protein M9H77_29710 [Catharanthus roseus]
MHMRNPILTRVTILVMILCSEASEEYTTAEGVAQSVYMDTGSCSAVGFDCLVESQEGLDTEVGPRADLVGVALMCLDSLRLPSCGRNPHVGDIGLRLFKSSKELIVSTPIDVSKIAHVKYPDSDIYVENVILSGDLIALPFGLWRDTWDGRLSKHYSQVDCRRKQMTFLFTNAYEKPHCDQGYNFDYDLVFESVRGLHCTWPVPRTRASFDGVDVSNSREWIYLKRSVDRGGCGPIGLHGHRIMLCGGIRLPSRESRGARHRALVWYLAGIDYEMSELGSDDFVVGSRLYPWSPIVTLHVILNSGVETALMCLDSLRLSSYARNPHVV